jgi:hypothetical protein
MITPDEEILKAILNLEGNPNWEVLRKKWFRKSLSETTGAHEAPYTKGMQDQIISLIDTIDGARELHDLVVRRKPR